MQGWHNLYPETIEKQIMDYPKFIAAVAEMRRLQNKLTSVFDRTAIEKCKAATRKVDEMLAEYAQRQQVENGQLELFAETAKDVPLT